MHSNSICIVLLIFIWIINGSKIRYGIKQKVVGEIYHHTGIGIFFTLLVVEKFYKNAGLFLRLDIFWLKIIGYALYIPPVFLIFGSLYQLKTKSKADSLGQQGTNSLIDTGVFSIIRHPMWIGFSIWSFALLLCFQSLFSLVLAIIAIICFRIASNKEDEEGIINFGDSYREYMEKVSMWNFIKQLWKKEI